MANDFVYQKHKFISIFEKKYDVIYNICVQMINIKLKCDPALTFVFIDANLE